MSGRDRRVAIIGAGIGGLTAAILLAARGCAVTLCERAPGPGGKISEARHGDLALDTGPTLLTSRAIFEAVFAAAGATLTEHVALTPLEVLGRHVWPDGTALDLHRDDARNADAIGARFGAAEARGYLAFRARAQRVHAALERSFLENPRPTALGLAADLGMPRLLALSPFAALQDALATHFRDPRLIQLFGRYATYVGASPQLAPATLMLVAEIEQAGLWRVAGGMVRLAEAMAALATASGARLRFGAAVTAIEVERGRAAGLRLADGERVPAEAVIANADIATLAAGALGAEAARAVEAVPTRRRSHSAVSWAVVGRVAGRAPLHTNLVFADPRGDEHAQIAWRGRLPAASTLHLAALDRGDEEREAKGPERLVIRMSAPARGDGPPMPTEEALRLTTSRFSQLAAAGFEVIPEDDMIEMTTPEDHERRYPGTGGALYGPAMHGWNAAFERPRAATRLPGLFVAGAGAHPGAGIAMAALSGRFAAEAVLGARA
jgi:1-hydroxycarotenoid 3,4-desaturase